MSQFPPPPPGFSLEQGAAAPPAPPMPTPRVAPPLPDGFAIEHAAAALPATPPYAPGVTPPPAGAGIAGSAPPATVAAPPPEQPAPVEDAEGLYQRYVAGQGPSDAWLAAYATNDPRTEPPGWQVPMTPHQLPGQDGPGQPIQPPPAGFVLDPTSTIPPGAAPGPTSDQILAAQMQAQHPGTQWVVSDDPRPAFAQAMERLQTPAAQAAIANAPGGSQWVARETHNAGAQIVGELGKTASFLEQAGSKVPPSSMALYGSPTSASQPAPSPAETAAQQALSQKAESDRQAAQQLVDEHPVTSGLGRFAVAAAGMAPQLAATLAAPITAPLVWGVTGAASAYNRAKAAGASDATAGIESMWGGGIGALTSLVPGLGNAHPSFLRGLLQNAAAMGAQATADDLVARHGHGDPRTIQDILGDALTAAGVGALFHTVFHGPAALRSLPDKALARQLGLDPSDPALISVLAKMRATHAAITSGDANPTEAIQDLGRSMTPQEQQAMAQVVKAWSAPAPAEPTTPEQPLREYHPAALGRQIESSPSGVPHAPQAPVEQVRNGGGQQAAVQPVRPPAGHEPGPAAGTAAGRPAADAVAGPAAEPVARAGAVRDAAPAADQEPGPARIKGQDAGAAEVSGGAVRTLGPNQGWKLHLATAEPEAVSDWLKAQGYVHKVGRNAGQDGKDVTVYVGSRDDAQAAAGAIQRGVGHLLAEPRGETLTDDVPLAPKVMGRFDVRDPDFHQYGSQGVPYLAADAQALAFDRGSFDHDAARQRADTVLRQRYGAAYAGRPASEVPPAPAPAPEPFEIQRQRAAVRKAAALLDGGTLTPGELPIAQHALAKARAKLLDLQADHLISGGVPAAPSARRAELTPELAQAFGLGEEGSEAAAPSPLDQRSPPAEGGPSGQTIRQSIQDATRRGWDYPVWSRNFPRSANLLGSEGPNLYRRAFDEQPTAATPSASPPANTGAPPASPKRKALPRPFSKQDLQAQIQDAHREQGGGVPQDVHDFANTLSNAFTFKRDGPYRGEVARHAGGKEAGKTGVAIMRSKAIGFTDDPAAAGGEDAINAFKDRYGPKGEEYYWQLVRDRAGVGFQDALQFARSSPDPQHQLLAAHYDAYQRGGAPKADVVPGPELETGEQFDSLGHPTRVVENADGERVLEDGGDIPPLPVDELSAVPVDKGTRQMAPEPELPEGDVFPAEHQPAFFDADKAGVSGQQTGVFGQPEFFGATGRGQPKLQFETEPAKVAPPDTEGVGGSRNALDPRNTAEMFEPRPAAPAAAPRSTWEQRIVDAIHGGDVEQARKVIRTPRGRELFNAATGADVSANASPAQRQAAVDQWASKREAGPTAALEVTTPQPGDLKAWGTYAANPHMTGGTLASGLDNPTQGRAAAVDFDAADPAASSGAGSLLGGAMEKVKAQWHALADAAKEFSGQMFPRTTRLDRASGEAMARLVASPIYAEEAAPLAAEDVIGPPAGKSSGIDPELDRLAGVVMVEDNLRGLASQLREQGDDDAADRVKTLVGGEGSPFADEAAYRAALHDPRVRDVVDRYRDWFKGEPEANYRVSQGIATDAELPNRGQQTDTRVNLIAVKAGEAPAAATVYAARRGRLTNPLKKPSPFAKKAYGTADGYDVRLSRMIENTLKKGTYTANLHRLYNTLVDRGLAVWGKPGERPTIKGQEGVPLRVDVRGKSHTLYMPRHVYGEVVRALKVDEPPRAGLLRLFAGVANHGALLSLSEGMTHLANAMGPLFRAPGGATNYARWAKDAAHLLVSDPAARRDLAELARIGALPSRHALAGWQRAYPPALFKHLIDGMTRAARLTMSSAFDRAVEAKLVDDTETARRDFVNQLGQYLKEAQGDFQRLARDTALGPFVTAGTNYVAQGFKAATLSNGLKGRTGAATAQLRLRVLGGMAAAIGAVAVLNLLRWKRMDGAKDIPLGAVRLADGPGGKHRYWDPLRLLGITRAARDTGLLSIAEGKRRGETGGEITDHAARDVAVGLGRPFAGPLVNATAIAATGKTPEGYQEARKAALGKPQVAENLKAAARTLNPVIDKLTGGRSPVLGPFSTRQNARAEESWATTRAREYVHEQEGGDAMTAEQSAAFDRREQLRAGLQTDRKAGTRELVAALRRHEITLAQAKEMAKDSGDADAVRYVRQIRDLNAALDVFRTAVSRDRDPAEVRALARVVAPMVARDAKEGKITAEQMKAYNRELLKGIGHPAPAAKAG